MASACCSDALRIHHLRDGGARGADPSFRTREFGGLLLAVGWRGTAGLGRAFTLLFGGERATRPAAYAVHLWLVFASGVAVLVIFASLGLLIPDLI